MRVERLGKRFFHYRPDRPRTLQEALLLGPSRLRPTGEFWALKDVSFELAPGRMLGIVGANGAGKSTLLRLLGGVGRPDEGRVAVRGRVGAFLDVRSGLHPMLTGRENIFLCGVVAGLTRREVAARFDRILAFAELEEFVEDPTRTYSLGMQMRLAFSVFVHADPEVLLMDEILVVGDHLFQKKCWELVASLCSEGRTVVFASHAEGLVRSRCDEALWLQAGRVAAMGEPEDVVSRYLSCDSRQAAG